MYCAGYQYDDKSRWVFAHALLHARRPRRQRRLRPDVGLVLFSAVGLYPVAAGSGQYALGSLVVKTATLKLENGKTLTIEAVNQSDKNVYVESVSVNGQKLDPCGTARVRTVAEI